MIKYVTVLVFLLYFNQAKKTVIVIWLNKYKKFLKQHLNLMKYKKKNKRKIIMKIKFKIIYRKKCNYSKF